MTHPDDETLSAWIEGDLPDDLRLSVDAHLRDCARCRDAVATLRELIVRFREPPPPWARKEAAWKRVAERLHDDDAVATGPRAWVGFGVRRPMRTRWLAAAGGLVAAAAAGILLWTQRSAPPPAARESAAVVALIGADELAARDLNEAERRGEWTSTGVRQAITAANDDIAQGVAELREALRQNPDDPVLTDLLRRAVQHRLDLAAEAHR
jgi:anti-sigma factor RsiW